jgi:hypothetical protein
MVEGMNSNMMYLIYCKNFCKYHNVTPPSTTKKKTHFILLPPAYRFAGHWVSFPISRHPSQKVYVNIFTFSKEASFPGLKDKVA